MALCSLLKPKTGLGKAKQENGSSSKTRWRSAGGQEVGPARPGRGRGRSARPRARRPRSRPSRGRTPYPGLRVRGRRSSRGALRGLEEHKKTIRTQPSSKGQSSAVSLTHFGSNLFVHFFRIHSGSGLPIRKNCLLESAGRAITKRLQTENGVKMTH